MRGLTWALISSAVCFLNWRFEIIPAEPIYILPMFAFGISFFYVLKDFLFNNQFMPHDIVFAINAVALTLNAYIYVNI